MYKARRFLGAILAPVVLVATASFPAVASEEYVPKVETKTLHKAPLPGVEGKEMIVKHFTFPPKFVGEKHMHSGPVYVYVLQGELTVELGSGSKTFKAGDLYPEDIGVAMVGKNPSGSDDLQLLVIQVEDMGKPMMIKMQ